MAMSRSPLVSIIVNNYNYGRFLRAAIESALRQSYEATEVIVVDDGSTDESRAIICEFAGRIIPVLKENGGQASAFNAGLAASSGQVVIFLDADDILLPETAERVAAAFRANPGAAKIQYRMDVVDASGQPTGGTKPAPHLPLRAGDLRSHVLSFPDDIPWLPTSGNAFSAEVLRRIFPMPQEVYRICADFYLSNVTPLFGPVIALEEVGACYRVHGKNSYEPNAVMLRLKQIRDTIRYTSVTHWYIHRFAIELNLPGRPRTPKDVLSVSFIANRLISYRLEPHHHPIIGERIWRLLLLGLVATTRRFDVSWTMRAFFGLWFIAMVVAPRRLAHWLALRFLFPETRASLNRLLGSLHAST
jgi:glycosyltransferase involved in cell wall biosynthesis